MSTRMKISLSGFLGACLGVFITGAVLTHLHNCKLERLLDNITQQPVQAAPVEPKAEIQAELDVEVATVPNVKPKIVKASNPYLDVKFSKKFSATREVAQIRKDNYGTGKSKRIKVYEHKGGEAIDKDKLEATVRAVMQRMPNIKTTDNLVALCMETLQTETRCGAEKVSTGIRLWNNYGIAQFRLDTAEETLAWLKKVRRDVYEQVMDLTDRKHDLEWDLSYNVPFSIALMIQYYWRRVPDLYEHIGTKVQRAELWKSEYNSSMGKGTVQCYLNRNGG